MTHPTPAMHALAARHADPYTLLAYVAGPYRSATVAGLVDNVTAARAVAVELWTHGLAVVCPHLNTGYMDGICPDDAFLDGTLTMLRRCDLAVFLPNWQQSSGSVIERTEADALGIPCYDWPGDRLLIARLIACPHSRKP